MAATAQVFLQRYYFRTSVKKHDVWVRLRSLMTLTSSRRLPWEPYF